MSRGVVYLAWGERAIAHVEASAASIWRFMPDLPVLVVGDEATVAHFADTPGVQTHRCEVDPFDRAQVTAHQFMAGRVKPLLASIAPWDEVLYVDADTTFVASPEVGFNLLERWDVVVAETETRSLVNGIAGAIECRATAEWLGTPHLLYHNSGMIFWRRNERTARLFELWAEEWQRYQGWDEQVALLRALLRSEALYLTVPHVWNCRERTRAVLVHHQFGTKVARRLAPTRAVTGRRHATGPLPRLIRVEVAPGRYASCRPEEVERVKAQFAHLNKRRLPEMNKAEV